MKDMLARGRAVTVVVRQVVIRGGSGVEMRRLSDALLPALERAFGAPGEIDARRVSSARADRVSQEVRAAVVARLEQLP